MHLKSPSCNCFNYFSDSAIFFHGKLHYIRTEMRKDVGKKTSKYTIDLNHNHSMNLEKDTERKNEKAAFWRHVCVRACVRKCMHVGGSHHSSCV